MCGRYVLRSLNRISHRFHVEWNDLDIHECFNVSPTQIMPVIIHEQQNCLKLMQWGLIPFWSKNLRATKPMINARIEGIMSKPTFRVPVRKHRCLIPADGFYEWKKEKGRKVPYYIRRKARDLFVFAGIFDVWHGQGGVGIETFAILTTRPNVLMEPIHNRMPVILEPSREQEWLEADSIRFDDILHTLEEPYPSEKLEAYPVSRQVNVPRLDFPGLIEEQS